MVIIRVSKNGQEDTLNDQQLEALILQTAHLYSAGMAYCYPATCRAMENPPPVQYLFAVSVETKDTNFWKLGQDDFVLKLHEDVMNNQTVGGRIKENLKAAAKAGKNFVVFPSLRVTAEEAPSPATGMLKLTAEDRRFLRSLRISTGDKPTEPLLPTANRHRDKQL